MKLYIMNCGQMITPDGNILAAFNTEQLRLVVPVPAYSRLSIRPKDWLLNLTAALSTTSLPDENEIRNRRFTAPTADAAD